MKFRQIMPVLLCICMGALPGLTLAQNNDARPPVTTSYALTNAHVVTAPGEVLENATLLLEDGLIRAVGINVVIPAHAEVIKCDSMYIYAGFIEALSHTGIPAREDRREERPRVDNPGDPPNDLAGITPEMQVRTSLKAGDKSIERKRELGFTISHVVPEGRMLPGKGALLILRDDPIEEIILKDDVSLYAQFRGARGMYPSTVIGVMAKWKELYRQATYKLEQQTKFAANSGVARPTYDAALEGMFPVVRREIPVFFNGTGSLQVHQALHMQSDLGFDLVIAESKQGWRVIDELKAHGKPVIVSLDLPEDKSEKADKKTDQEEDSEEAEPTATDIEKQRLEERRAASLKAYQSQAATLHNAGISIAFSTVSVKEKEIRTNLRTMISQGLPEEAALAALTTIPAEFFGIQAYAGTIAAGKMANLVVCTDNYFSEDGKVRHVFVEGIKHSYEAKAKKPKKSSGDGEPAEITGTWSYEVELPDQVETGSFTITGEPGDYSGELVADNDEDEEVLALYNIEVNGSEVTFNMDMEDGGQTLLLLFNLEFDTEIYDGSVSVGEFGAYQISGQKIPD